MAKPNYSFQKRQKELAKQAKKEEKRLRKQNKVKDPDEDELAAAPDSAENPTEG